MSAWSAKDTNTRCIEKGQSSGGDQP